MENLTEAQRAFLEKYKTEQEGKLGAQSGASPGRLSRRNYVTENGGSESGATLSDSAEFDPYLLSLEDLEGSEEDVNERISTRLSVLGIDAEEDGGIDDGIILKAKDGAEVGELGNLSPRNIAQKFLYNVFGIDEFKEKSKQEILTEFNSFITTHGDLKHAENLTDEQSQFYKNYQEARKSAPQKTLNDAIEDLNEKKVKKWERKEGTVVFEQKREITQNDFNSEEEYKEYKSWRETGILPEISKEKAEEHRIQLSEGAKIEAGQYVINNLKDKDKKAIQLKINKDIAERNYRVANIENEFNKIDAKQKDLEFDINQARKAGASSEELYALRKRFADISKEKESFNDFINDITDEGKLLDENAAFEDFNKDYSLLNKLEHGFKNLAGQGIQAVGNMAHAAYYLSAAASPGPAGAARLAQLTVEAAEHGEESLFKYALEKADDDSKEIFKDLIQNLDKEGLKFAQGTSFDNAFKSPGQFVDWAANTSVQAIPSLTLAFTGSAAMPLFFLSGYGSKFSEQAAAEYDAADRMKRNKELLDQEERNPGTLTTEEIASINDQMDEDAAKLNIPAWKQMSTRAIAGAAEVVFERLATMRILRGANKAINPLKQRVYKSIIKSQAEEGLSEGATEFVNNWAASAILGEDKNLFDGVVEAAAGGGLIGGAIQLKTSAPAIYKNVAASLFTKDQVKEYRQRVDALKEIVGEENIDGIFDENIPLPKGLSKSQIDLVEDLRKEAKSIEDAAAGRIGEDLSAEDLFRVGELNLKMNKINNRFVELAESGTDFRGLRAAEKTLRKQYDDLANQREAILTDKLGKKKGKAANDVVKVKFDAKAGYKQLFAQEAAIKRAQSGKEFDNLNATEKSERIKKHETEAKAKEEFYIENNKNKIRKNREAAQGVLDELGLNNKIEILDDKSFRRKLKELNQETDKPTDALIDPESGDIFINEDVAAKFGRTAVASHEVLHAIVGNVLTQNQANQAGKNLLDYLEQSAPETYSYIKARLDGAYTNDLGDKNVAYYEEAMNALSDYVAEGNKLDLGVLKQAKDFINKALKRSKSDLSIDDAESTLAFIARYAKNNKTETINKRIARVVEDEKEEEKATKFSKSVKFSKNISPESQQEIEDLLARYKDRKQQIDKFIEDNKERLPKDADGNVIRPDDPAINRIAKKIESLIEPVTGPLKTALLKRLYDPIPADAKKNVSRETFAQDIETMLRLLALNEYNPEKQSIEDFLVKRGYLRANALAKELGIESAQEGGIKQDIEAAKSVAVQEDAKPVAEDAKYKSLVERKIVSDNVLNNIKDKVKLNVRLLKTRMDKAVSKNVTVRPYIAEIRKIMGKQADIDLKKEMGGVKDGKFRKFLLKHKRAILENMTTTYLSTAMPNALQKKVNGVFTSDWKGKKIDRETVATDQAGRTSGAEISRRLPNVSTRLSDADFLSNFLNEDGSLIRGRKESLAKAIAEELSFDIISESLQNPDSDIRQAFEQNQEALGVQLGDNYIAEVNRDIERGNVKRSKSVDIAREAIDAYLENDIDLYEQLILDLPVDERELLEEFIADQIVGTGIDGFKKPLLQMIIPENLKQFFDLYKATNTNKKQKVSIDQMLDFSEALLDVLPPALLKHLAPDVLGLHYRYGDVNRNLRAADLLSKFKEKQKQADDTDLGFNPADIKIMQAGFGIFKDIEKNVYLKEFKTQEEKYQYYRENYGEIIDKANDANIAALDYILDKAFDIAVKDPSKMVGFLRILEGQTNLGKALRGLTALRDLELYAKPQGVYVSKDGKNYYNKLTPAQKKKLESGDIIVNKNNPIYKDAVAFAKKRGGKKGFLYYMGFKGEHKNPSAKVFAAIAEKYVKNLSKAMENPAQAEAYKHAFRMEAKGITSDFEQQLNSKLVSDMQDAALGTTSEAADLRLKALPAGLRNAFVDNQTGLQSVARAQRKINDFLQELDADQYAKDVETTNDPSPVTVKKSKSEDISRELNEMIARQKGVNANKEFSRIQAQLRGKKIGRYKFFIRPAADDFRGLIHYAFAGKGKQGEADMKFFEEKLMEPYFKGIAAIDALRQQIKRDYKRVGKIFKEEIKLLSTEIPGSGFNYDHALRVYMWNRQGLEIEGLSKRDKKLLLDAVNKNPELINLADALLVVARKSEWPQPTEYWEGGSILSDLNGITEKVGRKKFLQEFEENADAMFNEANLNKIEALYGREHREAIKDAIYAMKNGTNRPFGNNKIVNKWLNWINGATGAIMFFNRRSALLQVLSAANFINWSDNNPAAAAKAFANQKQYWSDFAMIFNSDKLKERRGGLKQDVNANEIADAARGSKNSPQAILRYLLKIGFTPTQIADSFAIALGGASFYRNRVNRYLSQGLSQKEAQEKAFLDFSKKSDEAQQSSDPALVSQEQRSVLGRLVLAFANTPIQYTRLMKKAGQDLINGRGNPIEHVSKIAYYGLVQNFIFSALQSALFALAFDDEGDDEETDKRTSRVINSMVDTILRGSGLYGAIAATIKNTIVEYSKQQEKGWLGDHAYTILAATSISPPINSKLRKLYSAIQTRKFEKENVAERGWALTADGKLNLGPNYEILGKVLSGTTNVPLDRVVDELKSISEALDGRNKAWQRIALALGWKTWDVGVKNEEADLIQAEVRKQKRASKKETKKSDLREAQLRRAGIKK